MFLYDKDIERVMQAKKREIIGELHEEKIRILKELSGVDKLTLTKLRELIADNKRIENNLDVIFNKHNSIINSSGELLDKYEKELEKLIEEAPFDDLKKAMTDFHNVESYGVKPDSKDNASLNVEIVNNLLERGLNVFFPSGTYYFNGTIHVDKPCHVKGNGEQVTKLVCLGSDELLTPFIDVTSGSVTISDFTINVVERDENLHNIGITIGKQVDGLFTNISRIKLENLVFYNFSCSIVCDGVYFLEVDNVYTYWDVVGFQVNKRLKNTNGEDTDVESTTIMCNRLYCGGCRRSYDIIVGSIGWEIYKTTDVTFINCVSEGYDETAVLKLGVNYTLISPYFEYTNKGIFLENNTGVFTINNPYFNSCATETKVLIEQAGTNIVSTGGRVTTSGYTYINKTTNCKTTIFELPNGVENSVASTNGWEWDGVNIIDDGILTTRVNSLTAEGYSVVYYGNRILLNPTEVHKYGAEPMYLTHQGTRVARIDDKGFALADSNGNYHILSVDTNGNLTISK